MWCERGLAICVLICGCEGVGRVSFGKGGMAAWSCSVWTGLDCGAGWVEWILALLGAEIDDGSDSIFGGQFFLVGWGCFVWLRTERMLVVVS